MVQTKKIAMVKFLSLLFFFVFVFSCRKTIGPVLSDRNAKTDVHMFASGFVSPLCLVEPPDSSRRLFVVDQPGKIWIIDSTGNKLATPFLDLSSQIISL